MFRFRALYVFYKQFQFYIAWSALTTWDFDEWICYPVPFLRKIATDFSAMVVIESAVLRYYTEFIWKRVPPINPEFTSKFLIVLNTFLSILTAFITIMSANLK